MAIKVGILLDSTCIPAWQSRVIESIESSPSLRTYFILLDRQRIQKARLFGRLYESFQKFDRTRSGIEHDALAPISTKDTTRLHKTFVLPEGEPLTLTEELNSIAALRLDVIIALAIPANTNALCDIARYGLWFYWHDYSQTMVDDGSTVGFWEVLKRRPYMKSALLIKQASQPDFLAGYVTSSAVHVRSHHRTRNEHLWKLSSFVARTLERLQLRGPLFFEQCQRMNHEVVSFASDRTNTIKSRTIFWPIISYATQELIARFRRRRYTERWILMFTQQTDQLDPHRLKPLFPPNDRFWADPDVVCRDDQHYVFFEDASRQSGKGRIAVIRINGGTILPPTIVLEKPYHLSYPFIFEYENELYLIPESAENRTIDLYRFVRFPDKVEFLYTLLDGLEAYDSTITHHDDRYWLFANVRDHPGASTWDELHVYYADSPISRLWRPHPMNPIVSDVRYARPAGHLFSTPDGLFRPSQNSSHRYGYALNINQITRLSTEHFEEQPRQTVTPDWSAHIQGLHTLNRSENCVVIDAMYRSSS